MDEFVLPLKRACPPELIESERLLLRRHETGWARTMYEAIERDRERLGVFLPWVEDTRSFADTEGYVRMAIEKWAEHELFDFSVFRKDDAAYVGNIGAHRLAWDHRRCEVGYWVLGEFEGKGYVSEALRALERVLFDMGFNRIEVHCSSANERSAAVPKRSGYRLEGRLRQDLVEKGLYRDTLIFAKLRSDP